MTEREGTLFLRVFTESGALADMHVRVLAATPARPVHPMSDSDVGVEALFGLIREWLDAVLIDGSEAS